MKFKKVIIIVLSCATVALSIDARSRDKAKNIESEKSFDRYARQGLTAVLFYEQGKRPSRKDEAGRVAWDKLDDQNDNFIAMFSAESKNFLYEEGDLNFAIVNVARRDELANIAKQYNVTQFPTIMLFNFGSPIRGTTGAPVTITGYVTQSELNTFIKNNIGEKLEKRKTEKAEYRKKKLEEARIRSYYAPYWGGGPYWGFGWGYPYYWGWGYPYRGYWW